MRFCYANLVLTLILAPAQLFAFTGSGSGTNISPYQITTCTQLQEMEDELNAHYLVMNDIDCSDTTTWNSGAGFDPVGDSSTSFTGSLDGGNFDISDLFINRGSTTSVGLFGQTNGAALSNINLVDVDITGADNVAAFIARDSSGSTITNCSSSGEISATHNAGGLGGYCSGTVVSKSHSTANITARAGNWGFAGLFGGLTGNGSVTDCYATGSISTNSTYYVGGLIGDLSGSTSSAGIFRCYATGAVTSSSNTVGGLSGNMSGSNTEIRDSYARGAVSATSTEGGVLGDRTSGTIHSSYYDEIRTTQSSCSGSNGIGTGGSCTAVNTSGTPNSTYFFGNSTNAPFTNWDFIDVWQICPGTDPKFQGQCTGTISGTSISIANSLRAQSGNVTVSLTSLNAIADDGKIVITFPSGFSFDSGGSTAVSSPSNIDGSFVISTSGQVLTVTRAGGNNVAGGTAISFVLSNIQNPNNTGATADFTISTTNSSDTVLDQNTSVSGITVTDCASGTYGATCTACPGGSSNPCNGNGTCDDSVTGTGECACANGFTGDSCDSCTAGLFGEACSECPGSGSCSGNGTCDAGIDGSGQCSCSTGFAGLACDSCSDGFFGSSCAQCPGSGNCNGNGTCDDGITGAGTCQCTTGFSGDACDTCASGFFGTSCTQCPGDGNCSGNGTCSDGLSGTGQCTCEEGFSGEDCATEDETESPTLETPTLTKKKAKKKTRLTCSFSTGDQSDIQYHFEITEQKKKGKNKKKKKRKKKKKEPSGSEAPTKTITNDTGSITRSFKKGKKYSVQCRYSVGETFSEYSPAKTIQR